MILWNIVFEAKNPIDNFKKKLINFGWLISNEFVLAPGAKKLVKI